MSSPTERAASSRVVIVTGAAAGIGRACAQRFAEAGWRVMCVDMDGEGARAVAAEIEEAAPGNARGAQVDVRDRDEVRRIVGHAIDEFGAIDALVHCAGVTLGRPFLEMEDGEWMRIVDTNLHGSFRVCQAVARTMAARRSGSIVLLGSVTGQRATSGRAAYAAAKAGVESLARSMAVDLASAGIRVNCVAPGAVETPLAAAAHVGEGAFIRTAYVAQTPMQRYARPYEIAQAALFLSTDAASYITGQVLNVDGGFTAAGMLAPGSP